MHVEPGDLRAALAYDHGLGSLSGTSQAQYAAPSAQPRRDQALHGGIGQMVEGQLLVFVFPRDADLEPYGVGGDRAAVIPLPSALTGACSTRPCQKRLSA
jgi:hypothetical protein